MDNMEKYMLRAWVRNIVNYDMVPEVVLRAETKQRDGDHLEYRVRQEWVYKRELQGCTAVCLFSCSLRDK